MSTSNDLQADLDEAEQLSVHASTGRALDVLFASFNRALCAGRFADVDAVIAGADPYKLGLSMAVGVLTITLPGVDKLPSRAAFYAMTWALAGEMGRNQKRLLGGLEKWTPIRW